MQYSPYPSSTNPWGINTNYDTPMVAIPNTAVIQTYNPFATATPIDTSGMEIRLRELYRLLERAKKKYHKYVSVAATTPTYVWIPVAGTISAGVVAGVYGDRANKKKKQIERKLQFGKQRSPIFNIRSAITKIKISRSQHKEFLKE